MRDNIPFYIHDIGNEEVDSVLKVMRSNWLNTGPVTKEFSNALSQYLNVTYCHPMNSATAAMFVALKAFGVGVGDEVITSAYTFCASSNVILHLGATPVFCDIKDDFTIDEKEIEKKITSKTKAIIPVDFGGYPCDNSAIVQAVESKKHLFQATNDYQKDLGRPLILTDAAHSFGTLYEGKQAGTLPDMGAFSFHIVKNITTVDGGALCANDKISLDVATFFQDIRELSLHGMNKTALERSKGLGYDYDVKQAGYKYNMTDIEASIGMIQLKRFPEMLQKRKLIAKLYDKHLANLSLSPWTEKKHIDNSYHLYPTLLPKDIPRDEVFQRMLRDYNITCNVHFKPLPLLTLYKNMGFNIVDTPKTLEMYERELTLPLYTLLDEEKIKYISNSLQEVISSYNH